MNDPFDIRVEIEPETPEMAALYSLWKGHMPIVYKMPLEQAMEHFREHLETLAEDMAERTVESDSPTWQASVCTDALTRETDTLGMDSQARHGLEVLSVLPPDWKEEIFALGEGHTFERLGKAWFYQPPHDQEDCLWEAAVKDGILHVEFEVGPEVLRRKLDIPVSLLKKGTDAGTERDGKETE